MNVMVAEDNPVNQEVAIGILETLDCEVTIVEDGAQALETYKVAEPGQFHLILMDCQMPIMDGMEATKQIRAWEDGRWHIPILALTANATEGSKASCLEAGMDDMLSKPFRRQELQALLGKWRPASVGMVGSDIKPDLIAAECTLDEQPLNILRDLDPDGSKRLLYRAIIKFVSYGDDLMANMEQSLAEDDMAEISRLAHSLKSSSANLGALDLAKLCQEIETTTKNQRRPIGIDQRIQALTATYNAVKKQLLAIAEEEQEDAA